MSIQSPLAWGQYYYERSHANLPGTDHALYRMTDLIKRGALTDASVDRQNARLQAALDVLVSLE